MAERQIPIASSSNIQGVAYNDDTQVLTVQFKSGGTYTYDGVSSEKADGFSSAESAGKYLHQNLKGQHIATKIG